MFPGYRVHAVTNGVHAGTWTHEPKTGSWVGSSAHGGMDFQL
jgi:hypothetical protein